MNVHFWDRCPEVFIGFLGKLIGILNRLFCWKSESDLVWECEEEIRIFIHFLGKGLFVLFLERDFFDFLLFAYEYDIVWTIDVGKQ